MNRVQKIARWTLIWAAIALGLAAIAVTVLYSLFGFPIAYSGMAFLGLFGFVGIGSWIYPKEKGAVTCDERDRLINQRAALASFGASYLVMGAGCMIPFFVLGYKAQISGLLAAGYLHGRRHHLFRRSLCRHPGPVWLRLPSGDQRMTPSPEITNQIRRLRFENGEISQQQLADRVGVTRQTILAIEANKYSPSLALAFRIARAFNRTVEEVFQFAPSIPGRIVIRPGMVMFSCRVRKLLALAGY